MERELDEGERAIWNVLELHTDPEKPVTAATIAEKTGIRERGVREIIAAMVNMGRCPSPVIALFGKRAGYYVSLDPKRVEKYASKLYHLGGEIFRRRDGILATAKRCGVLPGGGHQTEMVL